MHLHCEQRSWTVAALDYFMAKKESKRFMQRTTYGQRENGGENLVGKEIEAAPLLRLEWWVESGEGRWGGFALSGSNSGGGPRGKPISLHQLWKTTARSPAKRGRRCRTCLSLRPSPGERRTFLSFFSCLLGNDELWGTKRRGNKRGCSEDGRREGR